MRARLAATFELAAVWVLAIAACHSPLRSNRDAGHTTAGSFDLAVASELPVERHPLQSDAGTDAGMAVAEAGPDAPALGKDGGSTDRHDLAAESGPDATATSPDAIPLDSPVVVEWDSGLDGTALQKDGARADHGTGLDAGGALLCTGTLVAGNFLPFTYTGAFADGIVAGDLDGDGNLDLVTAAIGGSPFSLSVLLGKGDGTFAARVDVANENMVNDLALGDMNGDGKLDLVTANRSGTVSVRLGKGDGTLAAEQIQACAGEPVSIALGDLDADGTLDVATANSLADTVTVLLGKGDGTFRTKVDYAIADEPVSVLAGDLNGDRRLDLVVIRGLTGNVSVLLGKGDGSFGERLDGVLDLVSNNLQSAALGDVNGDGQLDLVIALNPQEVPVFLGMGDGTFAEPIYYRSMDWTVLSDVNGDDKLDLVLSGFGVSVLLGQDGGTFAAPKDSMGSLQLGVGAVGDFNRDGKMDLVASWSGWVGILLGSGDGRFAVSTTRLVATGSADSVALADLDGDDRLDIVANGGAGTVTTLVSKGNGTFADPTEYAAGPGLRWLVPGDVDGDGRLDIAGVNGKTVGVLLAKNDGGFGPVTFHETAADPVSALALGDVNGDGKLDIVTANSQGSPSHRGTASVLLGTGNGQFAAHVDYPLGSDPGSIALGDLDGDGNLDIVVANIGYMGYLSSVGVLLGLGDGTFAAQTEYPTGCCNVTGLALGDLNGDAILDVVAVKASGSATVLLGTGDGSLSDMVGYYVGSSTSNTDLVALVDVNGDSLLDIVTAGGAVTVLFGNGDGTFRSGMSYAVDASAVAVGDVNRDGRLDLVTAGSDGVSLLLGSCD
jgi:hypothetical protein